MTTATALGLAIAPPVLGAALNALVGLLVFHQDPVVWSTPDSSGSSSNTATDIETTISLTVVAAVLLGALAWSRRLARDPVTASWPHQSNAVGDRVVSFVSARSARNSAPVTGRAPGRNGCAKCASTHC